MKTEPLFSKAMITLQSGTAIALVVSRLLTCDANAQLSLPPEIPASPWVWVEGETNITLSGANASAWRDWRSSPTSPYGALFSQATGTAQPAYNLNLVNANPGLTFGSGKFLRFGSGAASNSASSDATIIIVANGAGVGGMISTGSLAAAGNTQGWFARLTATDFQYYHYNTVPAAVGVTTPKIASGWHIFEVKRDGAAAGSTVSLGMDGGFPLVNASLVPFVPATTATSFTDIGRRNTDYFTSGIAEVLVYERLLASAERTNLFNYLTQKYNISYRVTPFPAVRVSSPTTKQSLPQRASTTIAATAEALAAGATITKVEFYVNGSLLGSDPGAPYSLSWTPPNIGAYSIYAKAFDSSGNITTSPVINCSAYNTPPTITQQPQATTVAVLPATPQPVVAFTYDAAINLSALATDDRPASELDYTWADVSFNGGPTATFSVNGDNAAKNTVATFPRAGRYYLQVKVRDNSQVSVSSDVLALDVLPTAASLVVSPAATPSPTVSSYLQKKFSVTATDQFGQVFAQSPIIAWTVAGGGGIDSTGMFTAAGTAGGPWQVTATYNGSSQYPPGSGTATGTSSISVTTPPPAQDTDGDGLTDIAEGTIHLTKAYLADTDRDGLPDGWELSIGRNPLVSDASGDSGNGLSWVQEYRRQFILPNLDSNADGFLDADTNQDGLTINAIGLLPSLTDSDGDGVSNTLEFLRGTNPFRADTDGDGVDDASDVFALDRLASALTNTTGDTTAPTITILNPFGSTLN